MEENVIPLEKHQEIVNEMREDFESSLEEGFEEAFTMLKEAQNEVKVEREKSDIYATIARMEKISNYDSVKHLQYIFRELIQQLIQCTDSMGQVKKTKAYGNPIHRMKQVNNHKTRMAGEMEDDLRPEYDLKELKRAPMGAYRKEKFAHSTGGEGCCPMSHGSMSHGSLSAALGMTAKQCDADTHPEMGFPASGESIEVKEDNYGEKERIDV